ncbi:NADPH-dependent 2,4-dienoyl-CoA reductase/sulfur reductase-like enzyme [Planomicrobium koreense]|uniref:NADPH-dependent 2,4-dienoyl-CoA reductase/sulfur reductase-like enzyme n=1 Tax=Planococcus koreensis TaxID=112331 RepID=A0A7W8FSK4_9BACL|nr:CoA-disulfide reductase [Planococcus koreensis]MBB5179126.1 NADPH-dependent 2,4-dienoyl-CoA reductase/sulfur reductase-like enzyme [Planococcus koreensis]
MRKIVIIGAVGGGATVAAQIRFYDKESAITVFDRDSTMSYAACGTPYAIGEAIENPKSLLMADPSSFKEKRDIQVLLKHEALEIKRSKKAVTIKNLATGETFDEPYDVLILATGGSAIIPDIDGLSSADVFVLRSYGDMEKIKQFINERKPQSCCISGAGFIGIEMAENLKELGIDVNLVHKSPHVMSILDEDMSALVKTELQANGVNVRTGVFVEKVDGTALTLSNGDTIEADFQIMSVGIKPNTELAEKAGLPIGETGGIVTNDFMQTADPSIYALGDSSENADLVTGAPKRIPLAWPAHRQAYLIARHLIGSAIPKNGLLGTSIAKVFSKTIAMTGLSETMIQESGLSYETVVHKGNSNAGYYPDHSRLTLKVHYHPETRKILGAQCFGGKGVDKRIDVIVTAMFAGLTVEDLQALELCYAPPYSSPKDPINMVGYKAVK